MDPARSVGAEETRKQLAGHRDAVGLTLRVQALVTGRRIQRFPLAAPGSQASCFQLHLHPASPRFRPLGLVSSTGSLSRGVWACEARAGGLGQDGANMPSMATRRMQRVSCRWEAALSDAAAAARPIAWPLGSPDAARMSEREGGAT